MLEAKQLQYLSTAYQIEAINIVFISNSNSNSNNYSTIEPLVPQSRLDPQK